MLVMISPVPFLFSLSFSFFLSTPSFFSLGSGFSPLSLPLLTPVCGGGGERREEGSSVDAGFLSRVGGGGRGCNLGKKKEIPCGSRCTRVRGWGARRAEAVTWRLGVSGRGRAAARRAGDRRGRSPAKGCAGVGRPRSRGQLELEAEMLVGRTRRREISAKESSGTETPLRLRQKRPMGKSKRTISCPWRTGSKSSPHPPTPPWAVPHPAATRWSWWHLMVRFSETRCSVKVTFHPECPLCAMMTHLVPINL